MTGPHDRYDELAVGHVLGGLTSPDATEFRSHLMGCPQCRARVSELRGLADDLESAAREERAAQRLRVDALPRLSEESPPTPVTVDARRRWLFVAAAAGMAVLVLAVVWGQALRFNDAALTTRGSASDRVLAALANGAAVPVETRALVTGVASYDEAAGHVAISLGNLGGLADSNQIVVWVESGTDGDLSWETVVELTPSQLVNERLALIVETSTSASAVIVTVEMTVMPDEPNGNPVFRATLP